MASSLASQLKRIRLPTAQEDVAKGRVSLLFDARQAADIDLETVFSLGVNGLAELRTLNDKFGPFEKTLFSESVKSVDRALQTKDVNIALDVNIARFMRLVSPYFLLKPAQKALEWLVRRFRIHELNQEAVLEAVLPYHETKLFVRVVQILALDAPGMERWGWLQGVQKNGTPLDKDTLVQRCASDHSILAFIGDAVVASLSHEVGGVGRHLVSFYAATVIGVLEAAHEVGEAVVQLLLPFVLAGLKASSVDLVVATCMIVAQLARRATLAEALVGTVVDTLCLHASNGGCPLRHAITCCVLVCQTQPMRDFPVRAFRILSRLPSFVDELADVSAVYDTSAFVELIARRFVGHFATAAEYRETLTRVVASVRLPTSAAFAVAQAAVEYYIVQRLLAGDDAAALEALSAALSELVREIDLRYAAELDRAVEAQMQRLDAGGKDDAQRALIHGFVGLSTRGVRHTPVEGTSTTLFLSLNHSQPSVRLLAVRQVAANLKGARRDDAEFVSEALVARLADEDRSVVAAVLDIGAALVGAAEKRRKTLVKAIGILVGPLVQSHPRMADAVVAAILPCLFVTNDSPKYGRAVIKAVAESHLASKHPLLAGIGAVVSAREFATASEDAAIGPGVVAAINASVARALARSALATPHAESLLSAMAALANPPGGDAQAATDADRRLLERCGRLVGWLVLAAAASSGSDRASLSAARHLLGALARHVTAHASLAASASAEAQSPVEGSVAPTALLVRVAGAPSKDAEVASVALALSLLHCVVDGAATAAGGEAEAAVFSRELFVALAGARDAQLYAPHLKRFVSTVLGGRPLRFLVSVWTSDTHGLEHARALLLADAYMRSFADPSSEAGVDFQRLLPSLFVGLASPAKSVRAASVRCVAAVALCCGKQRATEYTLESLSASHGASAPLAHAHLVRLLASLEAASGLIADDAEHVSRVLSREAAESGGYGSALAAYVASNAVAAGEGRVQHCLLTLVRGVATAERLPILLPLLESLVSRAELSGYHSLSGHARASLRAVLEDYSEHSLPLLSGKGSSDGKQNSYVEVFVHALSVGDDAHSMDSPQGAALARVTPALFGRLASRAQKAVFSAMCDIATESAGHDVAVAAAAVMRAVPVPSAVLVHELTRYSAAETLRQSPEQREKRGRRNPQAQSPGQAKEEADRRALAHATVVLELLQTKDNVEEVHRLVPVLFDVLGLLLESKPAQQGTLDYPRQLALGALTAACRAGGADVDGSALKMDTVVQCVRVSDNPQTHHHALLLLATLAASHPDRVLQNIMPIFTFMGANVLRQDDSYSFHVIQRTIETVIPPLVASSAARDKAASSDIVVGVMRVFVDAVAHIPVHRRLRLFTHLVRTLGASEYLPPIVALLLERGAVERLVQSPDDAPADAATAVLTAAPATTAATAVTATTAASGGDGGLGVMGELSLALTQQVDAAVQLATAGEIVRLLHRLPHDKPKVDEGAARKRAVGATPGRTPSGAHAGRKGVPPQETERIADGAVVPDALLFDAQVRSAKQLRQFKLLAVSYVSALLSSRPFLAAVRLAENAQTEPRFLALLESLLSLVASVSAHASRIEHDAHDNQQQQQQSISVARFWKQQVGTRLYDAIDKVNGLLAIPAFVGVVSRLMSHKDGAIRRKSLALFNARVSDGRDGASSGKGRGPRSFSAADTSALLGMVPTLLACVGGGVADAAVAGDASKGDSAAVNRQTALLGIDLLARAFGQRHPDRFVEALPVVMGPGAMRNGNAQVVASGIVCVATLCGELGARVLPFLPALVPQLLTALNDSIARASLSSAANSAPSTDADRRRKDKERAESSTALLQMSAVSAIGVLVTQLPQFLSPYLTSILTSLSHRTLDASQSGAVAQKAAAVRKLAASSVPSRLIIPALQDAVTAACAHVEGDGFASAAPSIGALAEIAEDAFAALPKEDVPALHKAAFKVIVTILDVRTRVQTDVAAAQQVQTPKKKGKGAAAVTPPAAGSGEAVTGALALVEGKAIGALVALVMRLSENTFRPLFARLCEWGTAEGSPRRRLLPFFAAIETLARRLRSLFVPFAGGIVSTCVELLSANTREMGRKDAATSELTFSADEPSGDALVSVIASALEQCFLHDTSNAFLTRERFDALLRPLVDQLDNGLGGAALWERRASDRIVPCLAQMAVAAGSEALWKPLNYNVLLKTRSADAKIRLVALRAVHEFYKRLGEEFIILLPETIPFLAELMEDEDGDVERQCQDVIATIETFLGESLQKYF